MVGGSSPSRGTSKICSHEQCQKEFNTKHKNHIYCSNKCNIDDYHERQITRQQELRKESDPRKRMWQSALYRAKKSGLDFNITIEDIIIPKYCLIFGYKLKTEISKGQPSKNTASLDRIDNSQGYVKGNIQVISHKANMIKTNLIVPQVERLLKYMKGEQ